MRGRRDKILLFSFVLLNVIIGLRVVPDYGMSWDEAKHVAYGRAALKAYQGEDDYLKVGRDRKYYGPAYWMLAAGLEPVFRFLFPSWHEADAWHFTSWLTFQASIVAFYYLARRLVRPATALWTSVFYATQPLLWGHAFINQLDMPFMSFFMIALALGLMAVDRLMGGGGRPENPSRGGMRFSIIKHRFSKHKTWFLFGLLLLAASVAIAVDLLLMHRFILGATRALIEILYEGKGPSLFQELFQRLAADAHRTPLGEYLERASAAYFAARHGLLAILAVANLLFWWKFLWKEAFPRQSQRACDYLVVLLAGIVLGLTSSIRVAGPFAGLLVTAYALMRYGFKGSILFAVYWPIALLTSYASWPFLWGDPFTRYIESVRNAGAYAQMYVYYLGEKRLSSALPRHYLPTLLAVQWTEPTLLLLPAGVASILRQLRRGAKEKGAILILYSLWFLLPVVGVLLGTPIYDNFRHILFSMPPVFLVSGLGLDWSLQRIDVQKAKRLLPVLIVLPGVLRIAELHPYEYSHYNLLVGGVSGAYGRFETDYWCTAFRHAVEHVNGVAEEGATVFIAGPMQTAVPFARGDLRLTKDASVEAPDFAIACRWNLFDPDFFPEYRTLVEIGKGEAVFARVKSRE